MRFPPRVTPTQTLNHHRFEEGLFFGAAEGVLPYETTIYTQDSNLL